jgi:hypothetical protein
MANQRQSDLQVQPSAKLIEPFLTYHKTTTSRYTFTHYKLNTGFTQVDGIYPSAHEAMKAVMSEGLLLLRNHYE